MIMGDRGNIRLVGKQFGPTGIYFYTHWSGSSIKEWLANALERKQRWEDPAYLARIIFCELIAPGDDLLGETGYGISCRIQDNEHNILVVDTDNLRVWEEDVTGEILTKPCTFKQFLVYQKRYPTKGTEPSLHSQEDPSVIFPPGIADAVTALFG